MDGTPSDRPMNRGHRIFPRGKKYRDNFEATFGKRDNCKCLSTSTDAEDVADSKTNGTNTKKQ